MNTKSIFLRLIMLAGTITQNVPAASAARPLSKLEIKASGISLEIKEISAGTSDGILYFYAPGLSTVNAKLEHYEYGVIFAESDNYLEYYETKINAQLESQKRENVEALREGMICYKEGLGFGIVLSLQKIRKRAAQDACCDCFWFWKKDTINQRIVKQTPGKDGKTLVFLFGDRQVHNSYKNAS